MYLNLPRFTSCTSFTWFALAELFVKSFLSTPVASNILGKTLLSGVSRLCPTKKKQLCVFVSLCSLSLDILSRFDHSVDLTPFWCFVCILWICVDSCCIAVAAAVAVLKVCIIDLWKLLAIAVVHEYGGPKGSNTNQFPKTQISFQKHKSVSQNTN